MGRNATLAAVASALFFAGCTPAGEVMPDVLGLEIGEAIDLLDRRDLDYVVRDDEGTDAPPGQVLATQPGPGDPVGAETVIVLTVAVEPLDVGDPGDASDEAQSAPSPESDPEPEPAVPDEAPIVSAEDFEILTVGFGRTGVDSAKAGALIRYSGPVPLRIVSVQYTLRDDDGRAVATSTEPFIYIFPGQTVVHDTLMLYDSADQPSSIEAEVLRYGSVLEARTPPDFEVVNMELRGQTLLGELVNRTNSQARTQISCAALDGGGELLAAGAAFVDGSSPERTAAVDVLLAEVDDANELVCSVWDRDLF